MSKLFATTLCLSLTFLSACSSAQKTSEVSSVLTKPESVQACLDYNKKFAAYDKKQKELSAEYEAKIAEFKKLMDEFKKNGGIMPIRPSLVAAAPPQIPINATCY
ncbi:hypothetical protein N8524_11855 [Candidatus Puniceispirillum sp.]|nr:hypothetical protein [Candidatus Puniceispirillum sp.]